MPPRRLVGVPLEQAVGKLQLPPMLQHPANVLEWAKMELGLQLSVSTVDVSIGRELQGQKKSAYWLQSG